MAGSMSTGVKPIRTAVTAAAVVLAGVATADAQSAKDAERVNRRLLTEAVAVANAACGSAIVVKRLDSRPTFTTTQREHALRGCREAFNGIRAVCETQVGRAAVSSQVKGVNCGMSGELPDSGEPAVALNGGVLEYRYEIEPGVPFPNERRWLYERIRVREYLLDHLQFDGQPLYVQALRPQEEERLAPDVSRTNRSCGTSITVTFDWTGVPAPAIKDGYPSNYCGHALDAVERVCAGRAGREAVANKINRIVCGYAVERSVSLEDGVLVFKSDFQATDDRRSVIFEYLQNAL
jgi:hypothetical protein